MALSAPASAIAAPTLEGLDAAMLGRLDFNAFDVAPRQRRVRLYRWLATHSESATERKTEGGHPRSVSMGHRMAPASGVS